MAKTAAERREEIEQKIRRLQKEKRRLSNEEKLEQRRKRDHLLIVVGAHFLAHYPQAEEQLKNMTDGEVRAWVDSRFNHG